MTKFYDLGQNVDKAFEGLYFDKDLQLWSSKTGIMRRLANQSSLGLGYPYTVSKLRSLVKTAKEFLAYLNEVASEYEESPANLKGRYVIAAIVDGHLDFARVPYVHGTYEQAETELERLVKANPNKKFALFKCEGVVKSFGVVWE